MKALRLPFSGLLSFAILFVGCSGTHTPAFEGGQMVAISGVVHGGQQAVSGATIQLYTVGLTADGSPATALLTSTVTTDSGGGFSLTGLYHCSPTSEEVYLVSTGGNPGLSAGSTNPNLAMMAALGPCSGLLSTTYVYVNELTTVGAVAGLYPYMKGYAAVGSGTSDATALGTAFGLSSEYANTGTGGVPGATLPAGYYGSSTEITTLGDAIAACVNSAGGVAGDGSACGQLFTLATPPASGVAPTDTVGALIDILNNPTNNVSSIFYLATPTSPFQPELTSAPATWALGIVPMAVTPVFSVAGGAYAAGQTVAITTTSPSPVKVYYTTDGTTPTTSSTQYSGAVTVSASKTLKAIAAGTGYETSTVATASYVIATPTATPVISGSSSYNQITAVTIPLTDSTTAAIIYYTTDGTAPTTASTAVTGSGSGSVTVASGTSTTINAMAIAPGYGPSAVASKTVTVTGVNAVQNPPTISPASGTYSSPINVSIAYNPKCVGANGAQNYTVNGVAGTYTVPFMVSAGSVVTANSGACTGGNASNTTQATYAFTAAATPVFTPAGGTWSNPITVSMATSTAGALMYYTTDGTTPTTASMLYTGGLTVTSTELIQAIAVAPAFTTSAVGSAQITIDDYGVISTFAGTGTATNTGDGGQATAATLNAPVSMAFDASGDLYVGSSSCVVRKITPAGVISTVAGTGTCGYTGEGAATSFEIQSPDSLALDASGNLYIADALNYRIRKVTTGGTMSTVLGTGTAGYSADATVAASSVAIGKPEGVLVDAAGNIYFTDTTYGLVRRITASGGLLATVAGNKTPGFSGDGGLATSAELSSPYGLALDRAGNLYVADQGNFRIRKVTAAGIISTYAGTGTSGYAGDGAAATAAKLGAMGQLLVDTDGTLFVPDQTNSVVRMILSTGTISTVAGTGAAGYINDGGAAPYSQLNLPRGVALDALGNLYIADTGDNRVREVTYAQGQAPVAAIPTFSVAAGTYTGQQSLTISDTTAGATIYYTTDGTTPTSASSVYSGALTVIGNPMVVQAIAGGGGGGIVPSGVFSASYTTIANAPIFSAQSGQYSGGSVTVQIASIGVLNSSQGTLHYTVDETTPTASSPVLPNGSTIMIGLTAGQTTRLQAILIGGGTGPGVYATSSVTYALYYGTPPATPILQTPTSSYSCSGAGQSETCTLQFNVVTPAQPSGCGNASVLSQGPSGNSLGNRTAFEYPYDPSGTYRVTVSVAASSTCQGGSVAAAAQLSPP